MRQQVDEIVARMENRPWVLRDWGFARLQSYGLGVTALFTGPSGTGKTMAAEALAQAVGKDLYRIDLTEARAGQGRSRLDGRARGDVR